MRNHSKAYLYAGLTIIFWGTSASAFKLGLRYIDYFQLLFVATLTTVIFLFFVLLFQKRLDFFKTAIKQHYIHSLLLGFLNPFLYYVILFIAYSMLPAQVAQPLNFVWPLMLVLLSVPILKQKLKLKSIFALLVSFVGVIFISSEGNIVDLNFSNPLGVSLALSSSVVWALFWLFSMKDKREEVSKLFLNFIFALLFITITTLIFSDVKSINIKGLLAGIYIGLFEMGITFVIWLKALKLAGRTDKIGNLIYLTPFFSLIFISLILGEKIYITTFLGLILIIAGIFIQQAKRRRNEN